MKGWRRPPNFRVPLLRVLCLPGAHFAKGALNSALSLCELFSQKTALANFLAANPNISLDIPVINKFTPTNVPIAHTELDGQ
jgi:hypothetical protein